MNVELAEERIFLLADRISAELAETRSWTKKLDAFGAIAALGGFLSKPKDEEFETVYRERRLQPFWRLASTATYTYERRRTHVLTLAPEVIAIDIGGQTLQPVAGKVSIEGLEHCHEERRREVFIDGLSGAAHPEYSAYLGFEAEQSTPAAVAALAVDSTVVVPPQARGSMLVRDAIIQAISKIDADRVLEENVRLEAVDLYYRPVYAFRYRRAGKEAVVEFDALTGAIKATGGSTFESHMGKVMDPKFLLDIGAEAANLFIPGATIAKIAIVKGLEMRERAKNAPQH